jgi:hypothetical protein
LATWIAADNRTSLQTVITNTDDDSRPQYTAVMRWASPCHRRQPSHSRRFIGEQDRDRRSGRASLQEQQNEYANKVTGVLATLLVFPAPIPSYVTAERALIPTGRATWRRYQ